MNLIGQFATELYLPSIPSMSQYFHVPINIIQLTITVYVLAFAVGSLLYGTLSDIFGRKPIMLSCLIIGLLGSIVCCFSFNITYLFYGRFIQGLGFSGVAVVARSITKDVSKDEKGLAKLSSTIALFYSLAIAFAPVIGGYIEKYIFWRFNFILLLFLAIFAVMLCRLKMGETNSHKRSLTIVSVIQDYIEVLTNPRFLAYNFISALTLAGVVSYQTVSPLLLQIRAGLLPDEFGYTALIITIAIIIGNFVNGQIMPKRGIVKMIGLGCKLYIIAGVIFIATGIFDLINTYIIIIPMVLYMLGAGFVYPNCSGGAMNIFDNKAGTAASVYNCFQMIGAAIGSGLISTFVSRNQLPLGVLLTIIGIVTTILSYQIQIKFVKTVNVRI